MYLILFALWSDIKDDAGKTKVKANSIASSINHKSQSAEARVKSPVFIGVIKNIPTTYDNDKVKTAFQVAKGQSSMVEVEPISCTILLAIS